MANKRDQLEAAATKAIQYGGFNSLSFRTLADEVGVKSSSVHYYFPEKSDLAQALIEKYTEDFLITLTSISATQKTPKEQLKEFVTIFETLIDKEYMCLCGMLAAEVNHLSDKNKQLLSKFFTATEEWLYQIIHSHNPLREIPHSSRELAKIIISGLEGAMLLDRAEGTTNRIKLQYDFIDYLLDRTSSLDHNKS